jgi:hypothetical protein
MLQCMKWALTFFHFVRLETHIYKADCRLCLNPRISQRVEREKVMPITLAHSKYDFSNNQDGGDVHQIRRIDKIWNKKWRTADN